MLLPTLKGDTIALMQSHAFHLQKIVVMVLAILHLLFPQAYLGVKEMIRL